MARRFTQDEINNIVKDYNDGNGLKVCELAQKYNRNNTSIIGKLKTLGVYKNSNYRFSKDDVEYLKHNYGTASWDEILKRFPSENKKSIITKAHKLGISRQCSLWNDKELNILKEHYKDNDINKLCDLLPNKTRSAIITKADKLGLKFKNRWSCEEDELLSLLYPKNPIDDIIQYFDGRSRNAIILHAEKLGLCSFNYNHWTHDEDLYIQEHWLLMPDVLLAKNLGRTQEGVKTRRHHLGLYRQDKDNYTYENISKYVRGHIQAWKNESMKQCNYQCVFTGSKDFQIHHLYGVSNILSDIFERYNIEYKNFNDYTQDELDYILDKFIEEQDKYPLGVCVSKNIHTLFHSLYGQYYNTPEQWYQFDKDFCNGMYDNLYSLNN